MAKKQRYDIGFNWHGVRDHVFTRTVADAAKRRRLQLLAVHKDDTDKVLRRAERGLLEVGLFLNTQADGSNMESPPMRLCRSLKAAGALVVEDPDDAKIYANRGLQYAYLKKAGLQVPRHVVVECGNNNRTLLSATQRRHLGTTWIARPLLGLDRTRCLISSAQAVGPALRRGPFKPGQQVIISKCYRPVSDGGREMRFLIWYFFGHMVLCQAHGGRGHAEMFGPGDIGSDLFAKLINIVRAGAEISGLDWFACELTATKIGSRREVVITEPANALAELGPGPKAARGVAPGVMRLAAECFVRGGWRRAKGLPLRDGTTVMTGN